MTGTGTWREYLLQPQHFLHPLEPAARRSDYIVPDAAKGEFFEMRPVLQNNLASMDVEIGHVQSLLDDLMAQRNKIVLHMQEIDYAIATHKRLPIEILAAIFLLYTSGVKLPRPRFPKLEDPWHIGSLWKYLSIDWPRSYPGSDEAAEMRRIVRALEFAQQITPRGTRNLTIEISQDVPSTSVRVDLLKNILFPCATRFERIILACSPALLTPFVSSLALPFLALDELVVHCNATENGDAELYTQSDAIFPFFANASQTSQFLASFHAAKDSVTQIPYCFGASLRECRLHWTPRPPTFIFYFHNAYAFGSCRLYLESAHSEHPVMMSQNAVVMPHIWSLHATIDAFHSFSEVINALVLPSLIHLSLGGCVEFGELASLIKRSKCNLKAFMTTPLFVLLSCQPFFSAPFLQPRHRCVQTLKMDDSIIDHNLRWYPAGRVCNGLPVQCQNSNDLKKNFCRA